MTFVDHLVAAVLSDLARGLRVLKIEFCMIGALVPELLLRVRPHRATKDADAAVILDSLEDFGRLKERLSEFGFQETTRPYRLTHRGGGWVDLLPYSEKLAPSGRLELGHDGRGFHTPSFSAAVGVVLNGVDGPEAAVVATAAREEAGFVIDDNRRRDVFDLFQWFRNGAGI